MKRHQENPYAPPRFGESAADADSLRSATIRIYRGMGWSGLGYVLVHSIIMVSVASVERQEVTPMIAAMAAYGIAVAFFASLIRIAGRLGTDLHRNYRYARWMAILAASVFFPILTIPGILAIRRLEGYRNRVSADTA